MLRLPRPLGLATAATGSTLFFQSPRVYADSLSRPHSSGPGPLRQSGAKVLSAQTLRQVSTGSILGLAGGLVVGVFSKPLAIVIGLLVFGVQFLESRGIHLVPWQRLQGYAKGINLRGVVQDNAAMKLSFGVTFALAAFARF
ncbi:hypothetical protein EJ06DRAFT_526245 [Trichodelitschia bisporula]|uniref:FUN14-domain-containing protein n=1 Tax=Trichodelitschia bisporula TaxID=703511 RepID=A0A6G1I7H4_9PEZI|nr:hypothetical protein EJ06DRAFT_526245 [Trichodelitschia bisporula]